MTVAAAHRPYPLDAYENAFRCTCGEVFESDAGWAICPADPNPPPQSSPPARDGARVTRRIVFRGTADELAGLLRILAEHGVDASVDAGAV